FAPGYLNATAPPAPGVEPVQMPSGRTGLGGAAGVRSSATQAPGTRGGTAAAETSGLAPTAIAMAREGANPGPLSAATETGGVGAEAENRIRIIANRRNNALLIYATPSEYAIIEGMLRKIDIIPLQVMIEATIAQVDLNDALQYGTQFFFKTDHVAETLGPSGAFSPAF